MLSEHVAAQRTTVDPMALPMMIVSDGSRCAQTFIEQVLTQRATDVHVIHADTRSSVMSPEERRAYDTDIPLIDPVAVADAEALMAARILAVVVEPTRFGLPSSVKGWIDRTLAPGVAFRLDEKTNRMRPGLTHLTRLVMVEVGDGFGDSRGARRIVTRAVRVACRPTIRVRSFSHRRLTTATARLATW